MTHFFIIATVIIFSFHLSGQIFDKIAIISNWNSGEIDDMNRNKAFFSKGQNHTFFGLIFLSCFIFSLINMILLWNEGGMARQYAMYTFGLSTGTNIWSIVYFVLMNKFFEGKNYEAGKLKESVKRSRAVCIVIDLSAVFDTGNDELFKSLIKVHNLETM